MQITDSLGGIITITDLKGSIEQVEQFLACKHADAEIYPSLKRFDERRFHYWKHIHDKLLRLQRESSDPE